MTAGVRSETHAFRVVIRRKGSRIDCWLRCCVLSEAYDEPHFIGVQLVGWVSTGLCTNIGFDASCKPIAASAD